MATKSHKTLKNLLCDSYASLWLIPIFVLVLFLPGVAFGQVDFAGNWAPLYHEDFPERIPGPELGDYMGIPINEAARLRADSYDADRISVVTEYQCRPHGADYSMRGLANMRVDNIIDPETQPLVGMQRRMDRH